MADKPYTNPDKAELIGYFWSGKHHQVFKGINVGKQAPGYKAAQKALNCFIADFVSH